MASQSTRHKQAVRIEHATTADPDEFSAGLSSVAAGVRSRSGGGEGFRADVYAAAMKRLGLFTVRIQDARVKRGPSPYAAITVPVSAPLHFWRGHKGTRFHPSSAHILHTNANLDLRIGPASGLFVATFEEQWIDGTAWRLTSHQHYHDLLDSWHLDLQSSAGQSFRHFLDFIWAEACRGGQFTRSELAVREIENTCATLLILASETELNRQVDEQSPGLARPPVERAEEYLRAHIEEPFALDKLVEITGTSASTLLREFRKRYGMPPLQYLKNCRLEAARHELASTDPDETSVTEVAMHYGFYHLGRFAGYYKTAFGELPSETLGRTH